MVAQETALHDEDLYLQPIEFVLKHPDMVEQATKLQPRTKKQQIWLLRFQIAKEDEELTKLKSRLDAWLEVEKLGQKKVENLADNIANIETRTKTSLEERDKRLQHVKELDDAIAKKMKHPLD